QTRFGENYVQEGVEKILALTKLRPWLEWHFIGPLQSNKTREVAHHFDWVHSIDRLKIAERLSAQRMELPEKLPLQVCVQVNISDEESKSGAAITEAEALCAAVALLPGLNLRGLMAIPAPSSDPAQQRAACAALKALYDRMLNACRDQPGYAYFDTLSMGMSDDLEAAIAEGSTMVRVGTAIFGSRTPSKG
ncbi:MAG: YggS family pyridoxal phosphate-dependent enzyme, partial [Polynucleobacter sp.]|nr:YggS family pyridoxal phosphate-dependent enzyme [Polynucleobacter sp.]